MRNSRKGYRNLTFNIRMTKKYTKEQKEILLITAANPELGKLFIKFHENENIPVKSDGFGFLDSIENMYRYIKQHNKQLKNYLPKQLIEYERFEELADDIRLIHDKIRIKKEFIDNLIPRLRKEVSVKQLSDNEIKIILGYLKYDKNIFRSQHLSRNFNDLIKYISDQIKKLNDPEKLKTELLSGDYNENEVSLIYNNNNIIIFRIIDPLFIRKYGSEQWCISNSDLNMFFRFINPVAGNTQFMIFNFNYDRFHRHFLTGITINSKGKVLWGGCQDNYNMPVMLKSIIKLFKLPDNIIKPYKYDSETINNFELIRYYLKTPSEIPEKDFIQFEKYLIISIEILLRNINSPLIVKRFADNNIDIKKQDGNTALIISAEYGNLNKVKTLVEYGAALNMQNIEGETALFVAFKNSHFNVGRYLLERNADPNIKTRSQDSLLTLAEKNGYYNLVRLIINKNSTIKISDDDISLLIAVNNGWFDLVTELIAQGVDINVKDPEGNSALMLALIIKQDDIFKYLLSKGAKINLQNNDGDTVIHLAIKNRDLYYIENLIKTGPEMNIRNNDGNTPLICAIKRKNYSIARLLISTKKVDINIKNNEGNTALFFAIKDDARMIIELLQEYKTDLFIENNRKQIPLHYAASIGNFSFVKMQLKENHSFDINGKDKYGNTILMYAIQKRNVESAFQIIKHGIDLNITDLTGQTALLYAIRQNMKEIAELIIHSCDKACLDLKDINHETALIIASKKKYIRIIRFLLAKGASVDIPDSKGNTALFHAVKLKHREIIQLLIHYRANPGISNNSFESPMDISTKSNDEEILKLLHKDSKPAKFSFINRLKKTVSPFFKS